jgi:ATP phosphoribosyltransferase regulatory subunit
LSGRARKRRQIPQVGVELVGTKEPQGDVEVLEVAASVLSASGLSDFVIDLGDAGIARALLANVLLDRAAEIADALGRKDEIEVSDRMKAAGADPSILLELLRVKTLADGVKLLEKTPAAPAARRLAALYESAVSRGLGDRLTADLGEIRSAAYYTGMLFRAYARGSADAIGSGGRYDDLLARFGSPMAAVGFAIDLDALVLAVRAAKGPSAPRERVLVVGDEAKARELRDRGVVAVVHGRDGAREYASAWGFTRMEET